MITKYNIFALEEEFNNSLSPLYSIINESKGYFDYDMENDDIVNDLLFKDLRKGINIFKERVAKFIEKLPQDKLNHYYAKYINFITNKLPKISMKKLIIIVTSLFVIHSNIMSLVSNNPEIKEETKEIIMAEFNKAQQHVKSIEAGYTNNKKDPGNYIKNEKGKKILIGTNHGISAEELKKYLKRNPTVDDMKNLTYEDAEKILKANYWDVANLDKLNNQTIANIIYDGCVNQGVKAMRTIIRKSLEDNNIEVNDNDNIFSDKLINAINDSNDKKDIAKSILDYRKERYHETKNKDVFLKGWLNRLNTYYNQLDTIE